MIRFGGNQITISIAGGCALSSAGVSPEGLRCVRAHKITGDTPALLEPGPKPLFYCVKTAERSFVRNAGWVFVSFGNRNEITKQVKKEFETSRRVPARSRAGHRFAASINP